MKILFIKRHKPCVSLQEIEQEHFNQCLRLKDWHNKDSRTKNIIVMLRWCDWIHKKYVCNDEQLEYITQKHRSYLQQLELSKKTTVLNA